MDMLKKCLMFPVTIAMWHKMSMIFAIFFNGILFFEAFPRLDPTIEDRFLYLAIFNLGFSVWFLGLSLGFRNFTDDHLGETVGLFCWILTKTYALCALAFGCAYIVRLFFF